MNQPPIDITNMDYTSMIALPYLDATANNTNEPYHISAYKLNTKK